MNWKQVTVIAMVIVGASSGYALAEKPLTRTVTVTKVVKDKKARKDIRALKRRFETLDFSTEKRLSNEDNARIGRAEDNAATARALVRGLETPGDFPNGQLIRVSSQTPVGESVARPVSAGEVTFRTARCPNGTARVAGGYSAVEGTSPTGRSFGNTKVFFSQPSADATQEWRVGIDNKDNIVKVDVTVTVLCIPGNVVNGSEDYAPENDQVRRQLASHFPGR